ncbi:MAG: Gldg family protein [Phycisphaerae bacterium]|nr:Gldg family protein [Phycisphaerae bacterium]
MKTIFRQVAAVVFVLTITFSLISICQKLGKSIKADITQQKLYTLCDGTRAIIGKLNQPIKMRLYYAKTAAMKAPDNIKYFDNYYEFVKSLLEEYVAASNGMIELEVIDPRPYSDDEVAAIRYGIKRFPITNEEGFFFGLVIQTQFGVEKTIPVFSPNRQNFVEYDISYLIDTAIRRQKKRIGILSGLDVAGDDVTPYMARMMQMQGQKPKQPWAFVQQLKEQYEVVSIPTDVNKIEGVDILLIVHPKDFSDPTLFAIDQYVVRSGRTIVCVDPYCVSDVPPQQMMQMQIEHNPSSEMNKLLVNWGLEMPKDTFAGDRTLAAEAALREGQRPQKIIGFLDLNADCFNRDNVVTAQLNQVRLLFGGVLRETMLSEKEIKDRNIQRTPLVMTTARGNSWTVSNQFELMMPDPAGLWQKFTEGTKPVNVAYLTTGRFKSAFPAGIDIQVPAPKSDDPNAPKTVAKHIPALPEAKDNCAVIVFADVDFMSNILAYRETFFGTMVVGDNGAMLMNAIDDLGGSSELISIRSRGNFKRPFKAVDEIEAKADAQTAEEESGINAEIAGFENELQNVLGSAKKGEEEIIGSAILQKKKELELKIIEAKKRLRQVKVQKRERIEQLGNSFRNFNMLTAPAVSLVIAIILGVHRNLRKRKYISHASDA